MQQKIRLANGTSIVLTDKNYITRGSEGSIYAKEQYAYKIYHDRAHSPKEEKLKELAVLKASNIIRPLELIYNITGDYIGYRMSLIKNGIVLASCLSNSFHKKHNITPKDCLRVVQRFQEGIKFIHQHRCLIVDLNEFNFLVEPDFSEVYFIDVDSYQTATYPANAITPSIRDWSTGIFSELTDWYSFGILACWIFLGIHPFRGVYQADMSLSLTDKMKRGISVFNKHVDVPHTARAFDTIPGEYKEWFISLFEQKRRMPPPENVKWSAATVILTPHIAKSQEVAIRYLRTYSEDIISHMYIAGKDVVSTAKNIFLGNGPPLSKTSSDEQIFVSSTGLFKKASIQKERLVVDEKVTEIPCQELQIIEGSLFCRHVGAIMNLRMLPGMQRFIVSASWNVLPNSTRMMDGLWITEVLGMPYFCIPDQDSLTFQAARELQGYKIPFVTRRKNVIIAIGGKNGVYSKFTFRFDKWGASYNVTITKDVPPEEPNFCVLSTGVMLEITKDEHLEISSCKPATKDVKLITSRSITADMRLIARGNKAGFYRENQLFSISERVNK